ncbi:MAG: orotidine 5-phosphate decarboxylase [Paracoccaceae bacterium]
MLNLKTELNDVIYNAATQAFEAKVTVHNGTATSSYACAIEAPISMSFKQAAKGLTKQALRKHGAPKGLRSAIVAAPHLVAARLKVQTTRRGLPLGQYGFFRGRAA